MVPIAVRRRTIAGSAHEPFTTEEYRDERRNRIAPPPVPETGRRRCRSDGVAGFAAASCVGGSAAFERRGQCDGEGAALRRRRHQGAGAAQAGAGLRGVRALPGQAGRSLRPVCNLPGFRRQCEGLVCGVPGQGLGTLDDLLRSVARAPAVLGSGPGTWMYHFWNQGILKLTSMLRLLPLAAASL